MAEYSRETVTLPRQYTPDATPVRLAYRGVGQGRGVVMWGTVSAVDVNDGRLFVVDIAVSAGRNGVGLSVLSNVVTVSYDGGGIATGWQVVAQIVGNDLEIVAVGAADTNINWAFDLNANYFDFGG